MLLLILSAVTIALMIMGSVIACKRTPKDARFPMQWGMDGKVNYRASKIVAASLFPAVAISTLGFLTLIITAEEGAGPPSIFSVGIVGFNCILLLAIHIGFMYFGVRNVNSHT